MKLIHKVQEGESMQSIFIGWKFFKFNDYRNDENPRNPGGFIFDLDFNFGILQLRWRFVWFYQKQNARKRFSNIVHKVRSSKLVRWISGLRAKDNQDR